MLFFAFFGFECACTEEFQADVALVRSYGYGLAFDAAFKRPFFGLAYAYAAAFWTFDFWVFHFSTFPLSAMPASTTTYYLSLMYIVMWIR
jgi:hypothetical protein